MTKRRRSARPHVPELFAVECPACRMAVAVRGELAGAAARCPLCHADFGVPIPPATADATPGSAVEEDEARPAPPPGPVDENPGGSPAASLAVPTAPAAAASAAKPSGADLIDVEVMPPPAPDPELAFREPVPTVGSGDDAIELRRLSPEEKQRRRTRRNTVMLLAGALCLIVITILLGRGGRR